MKRPILLLAAALAASLSLSPRLRAGEGAGSDLSASISAAELSGHVRVLASDAYRGRRSGTKGGEMAAAYVARQFEAVGLTPAGDEGSWFQHFVLPGGRLDPQASSLSVGRARGKALTFEPGPEWDAFSFSPAGSLSGVRVVFAGYGIHAPDLGYDDYAGLDAKGKAVLVLRHGPREGQEGYLFAGRRGPAAHLSFLAKARAAQAAGAKAMILVEDLHHHPDLADRPAPTSVPGSGIQVLSLAARRTVARALLAGTGRRLEELERRIDRTGRPASRPLPGVTLDLTVVMKRSRVANVAGLLPGGDPELKEEVVVVGAHYDHLGTDGRGALDPGAKGEIRNGADDNASGTAGVLELAERFALTPRRPKRSLLFLCFAGEELGLLGSRHYVSDPIFPLSKTAAMLNMDMIGRSRDENLFIGGTGTSPVFDGILDRALADSPLKVRRGEGGAAPSDNLSFFRRGVPALFFFTGMHPDYHRATDDWEKLDYAAEREIVDLVGRIARAVADLPEKPAFVNVSRGGFPGRGGSGAYLGVAPDPTGGGKGAAIGQVMPGGPAAKAGLRAGDRVVEFGGEAIAAWSALAAAIRKHKPGEEVPVVVLRSGKRTKLTVRLGKR